MTISFTKYMGKLTPVKCNSPITVRAMAGAVSYYLHCSINAQIMAADSQ